MHAWRRNGSGLSGAKAVAAMSVLDMSKGREGDDTWARRVSKTIERGEGARAARLALGWATAKRREERAAQERKRGRLGLRRGERADWASRPRMRRERVFLFFF